jgi:hypothetical protein
MQRLPRYDDPQPNDEVLLVGADGRLNNLRTKVKRVVASDYRRDIHEIVDDWGRDLHVRRVTADTWVQLLDWEE